MSFPRPMSPMQAKLSIRSAMDWVRSWRDWGTLFGIGTAAYAFVTSGPLASLFRSTKAIVADPSLTAQLQAAPIADKAPLVAATDKLPK